MNINEYIDSLRGKKVIVVGLGVSNRPLIRLLLQNGISVEARDRTPREACGLEILALEEEGAKLCLGPQYLDNMEADVVFRTPGLNANIPQFADLRQRGTVVTSEMEAFFSVCPAFIIGITGSDGKTTTTTLIAKLLESTGHRVYCGGNIGNPLLPEVKNMKPDDFAVVELSSFQLMDMDLSPHIAVVTNLAPNHLDIHKDMQEYVNAKKNIFLHQKEEDVLILNADNEITASFVPEARGKVSLFSRIIRPNEGYFLRQDGMICRVAGEKDSEILPASDIKIPGVHNIENYMAAFCAVDGLVTLEAMQNLAKNFGGVAHRIQLVREKDGVRFYDSSIDSSPSRTCAALRSFSQKVILVAGGKDKGVPYDDLGPDLLAHVKTMVLTGPTADKIKTACENAPGYHAGDVEIHKIDDFDEAVRFAASCARPGDVVLLSPASTSFDRFRNFEERGLRFQNVVNAL